MMQPDEHLERHGGTVNGHMIKTDMYPISAHGYCGGLTGVASKVTRF